MDDGSADGTFVIGFGGEMVAASEKGGLGQRLVFFSSLVQMDNFGAVILIVALVVHVYCAVTLWRRAGSARTHRPRSRTTGRFASASCSSSASP